MFKQNENNSYFKEHLEQIKVFLMLNILKSSDKLSLCAFPITKKCWNIDWKLEDVTLLLSSSPTAEERKCWNSSLEFEFAS